MNGFTVERLMIGVLAAVLAVMIEPWIAKTLGLSRAA